MLPRRNPSRPEKRMNRNDIAGSHTHSVKESTMPQARTADNSLARTVIVVMALLLACAVAIIVALDTRPPGGLSIPAGSHVHPADEQAFGIQHPNTATQTR